MIYIYKIHSYPESLVYIGSTKNINTRFTQHKCTYNIQKYYCTAHRIFKKYGIDNCSLSVIKQLDTDDTKIARAYEQLYINMYRNKCVNERPTIYNLFFKKHKIEYSRQYQSLNKTKIKEKRKKYIYDYNRIKSICNLCGLIVSKRSLKLHQTRRLCKFEEFLSNIDI